MSNYGEDKLGWRQRHIRMILMGRGPLTLMQIAEEAALLCIDAQGSSVQDAIDFLSHRDGQDYPELRQPRSRVRWWHTDTTRSLHRMVQRGMIVKVSKGVYQWIE